MKGLNIFSIVVGISPFWIEKLFQSIIYSLSPEKLGITSCFSGVSLNNVNLKIVILLTLKKITYIKI